MHELVCVDVLGEGHGMVLFDEFCNWAIKKHIDLGHHEEDEIELKVQSKFEVQAEKSSGKADGRQPEADHKLKIPPSVWQRLADKLPWKRTTAHHKRRIEMFKQFDPNGNGHLSLAEIDLGVKQVLQCEELFNVKPVLRRAYFAAKNKDGKQSGPNADFIELGEFRTLLWYMRKYFEYWVMFDMLDASHDHRLQFEEFERALIEIQKWGLCNVDAKAIFDEIDADGLCVYWRVVFPLICPLGFFMTPFLFHILFSYACICGVRLC
jgi:hypothetical protein